MAVTQQGGLQASKHYFLSTEGKRNKSLCFVKLTDSALHSINMYLESKDSCLPKPTIEFINNTGVMSLSLNGETKKYEFTLSNMEGDGLQSNFQCIQQTDDGYLESLGSMLLKLQIHAKDDSYEKTKSKMAAADQAQKKFCTKEIKQNGIRLGQKLTSKRPGLVYSPEKKNNFSTKNLEPVKPNTNKRYSNFQTVVDQPIRKRIIHILAVKPYRRPELMLRLMKEGISEKDKKCINEVLADVGSLKGNLYSLANHAWDEVIRSWRFCSKEEMEIIQRKKQQFLKSDSGNEIQSPAHTQPLTFNAQSKSLIQNGVLSKSVNGCKKRKVMSNGVNTAGKTLKDVSPITPITSSKNKFSPVNKDLVFPNPIMNGNSTFSSKKNPSVNTQKETPLNPSRLDVEIPSPTSSTSDSDYSEIKQKYTRIESIEQRQQYEKDFSRDYDEYVRLYKEMKEVSDKFVNWNRRLNSCVKGSYEFKRITDEFNAEVKNIAMNTAYSTALVKYERLKLKISYIKNLINEYDCSYYAKKT